uniref:Putative secreted protein n=1 Tax=Anopheles darlingi TaxID=43151 RepID=A0A2M4DBJ8_ANODA
MLLLLALSSSSLSSLRLVELVLRLFDPGVCSERELSFRFTDFAGFQLDMANMRSRVGEFALFRMVLAGYHLHVRSTHGSVRSYYAKLETSLSVVARG